MPQNIQKIVCFQTTEHFAYNLNFQAQPRPLWNKVSYIIGSRGSRDFIGAEG